ncbi:MAG: hypothetical protein M1836_005457 [Candelina mexicana]|nr:MAG: hypothetical protein M1836_005457 [Candelina mexicana]
MTLRSMWGGGPLIIDSHFHLWPASEIKSLAWKFPKQLRDTEGEVPRQYSVDEWRDAAAPAFDVATPTKASYEVLGYVAVGADRKSHLTDKSGRNEPLTEFNFFRRVALGLRKDGEEHKASHVSLCRGIMT